MNPARKRQIVKATIEKWSVSWVTFRNSTLLTSNIVNPGRLLQQKQVVKQNKNRYHLINEEDVPLLGNEVCVVHRNKAHNLLSRNDGH